MYAIHLAKFMPFYFFIYLIKINNLIIFKNGVRNK
jgi:hypothetical protein